MLCKRPRFQFRIGTVLLWMVIVAMGVGWWVDRQRSQRQFERQLFESHRQLFEETTRRLTDLERARHTALQNWKKVNAEFAQGDAPPEDEAEARSQYFERIIVEISAREEYLHRRAEVDQYYARHKDMWPDYPAAKKTYETDVSNE